MRREKYCKHFLLSSLALGLIWTLHKFKLQSFSSFNPNVLETEFTNGQKHEEIVFIIAKQERYLEDTDELEKTENEILTTEFEEVDQNTFNEQKDVDSLFENETFEEELQGTFQKEPEILQGNKTKVIIHIGPHKTGTTSIQGEIHKHLDILARDNYVYPGKNDAPGRFEEKNPAHDLAFVLEHSVSTIEQETLLKKFDSFLQRSQQDQKNILLSSEEFSKTKPEDIKAIFGGSFDAHIVIGYRRFHEWLKSFYNQIFQMKHSNKDYVTWVTENYEKYKEETAIALMDSFGAVFDNVVVFNFHDEKYTLSDNFFCNAISGLKNMCQLAKQPKGDLHFNTRSDNKAFTQLIRFSKEKRIISKNVNDEKALRQIKSFVEHDLKIEMEDLPWKCISDDVLDKIYQYSVDQERTLFPAYFEERGGEARFKSDFDSFFQVSGCAIDTETILEDERWVKFLGSLGKG